MANLNCLRVNFYFCFPNVCQSLLGSKYMCEWVEFNKMKLFSKFLEQVNCFSLCLSSIIFLVSHIQYALRAVFWNFTHPPKKNKQPFKELCCLFFVQLGNGYIIICSLSLCVCVGTFVCIHVLLSLRTSQVIRSVVLQCYNCS